MGASLLAWAYSTPASAGEPAIVLQRGFDEACGVVFDPGGEYWATARDFVVLVHAQTGTVVASRPVRNPSKNATACPLAVAGGGRLVAYGDGPFVQVWDPLTDAIVFAHDFESFQVGGVSLSADGGRLAAVGSELPLKIWNTDDWQPIRTLWLPIGAWELSLDADGSRVAATGNGGWIFDVDSGALVTELPGNGLVPRFSPDGRHVALSSHSRSADIDAIVRADDGAIVQDLGRETGALAFSPDGLWVAVAREDHGAGEVIEVRSLADWELVAQLTGHQDLVGGLAIHSSPDKQLRVTASLRGPISNYDELRPTAQLATWEIASGRLVRPLETRRPIVTPLLEGSPDGRWLVAASRGADVLVWDLEQGRLAQRIAVATETKYAGNPGHSPMAMLGQGVLDVAFTTSSDEVLLGTQQGAQAWSMTTRVGRSITSRYAHRLNLLDDGATLVTPAGIHGVRDGAEIDPGVRGMIDASDDGRLLVANSSGQLVTWDREAQRELGTSRAIEFLEAVEISPDATRIAVTERSRKHGFARNTLVLDAESGAVREQIRQAELLAWSPDSRRLILQSTIGTRPILVVDPHTGRTLQTLEPRVPTTAGGEVPAVNAASFSADGTTLVTSSIHETVAWELGTGARRWTRAGSGTGVTSIASRQMLAVQESGAVVLLDAATGDPIVTLVADASEWLLHTPDGDFTGSHGADRLVAAVDRLVPVQLFQTASVRDRPDIVLARLGSTDVEQRERPKGDDPLSVPELRLESLVVEGRDVAVEFTARDPAGRLAGYNLLVNGVPAKRPAPRITGQEHRGRASVQLEQGENWIELSVVNEQGVESYRELRRVEIDDAEPVERDLYVLAFGVSDSPGTELDRAYAGKDAQDMVKLLARAYGFRSKLTQVHVDEQVTDQAVREAARLVERARIEDTVIVFVAGPIPEHDAEIEALLANTPARRKLLLVDARERERFVYGERSGAIVLSAAWADDRPHERAELENGLFAEALLNALTSDSATPDEDGTLTIAELERAVAGSRIEQSNQLSQLRLPIIDVDPSRVSELPLPANTLAPIAEQQQPDPGPSPHPEPRGCAMTAGDRRTWAAWMLVLVVSLRRAGRPTPSRSRRRG